MRDIGGFDSLLYQPADWLAMSIRAYATGTLRPSPLLPLRQRLQLANRITEAVGNPSRLASMLSEDRDERATTQRRHLQGTWPRLASELSRI
jgi:hypothetical protein